MSLDYGIKIVIVIIIIIDWDKIIYGHLIYHRQGRAGSANSNYYTNRKLYCTILFLFRKRRFLYK